jgi:hypothetical protein
MQFHKEPDFWMARRSRAIKKSGSLFYGEALTMQFLPAAFALYSAASIC